MKHTSVIALALLLTTNSFSQDLGKKLTYKTVAIPVSQALADISKQTGFPMYASEELKDEPIILRLNGVSTQEAMTHIATAMSAQWQKTQDKGYELYRSPELTAKLEKAAIDARAVDVKRSIQAKLAEMSKLGPFTEARAKTLADDWVRAVGVAPDKRTQEDFETRMRLDEGMPDCRALWQIVSQMDPKLIASVQPGSRVTFSTQPTKTQQEMPDSLLNAAPNWQEDHNVMTTDVAAGLSGLDINEFPGPEGDVRRPMAAIPSRIDLSVQPHLGSPQVTLSLLAFDEHNTPLACANDELITVDSDRILAIEKEYETADKQHLAGTAVPISHATQLFTDYEKGVQSRKGSQLASGELRKIILSPDDIDPLSTAVSDAFLGQAGLEKANLAACPDDRFIGFLNVLVDDRFHSPVLKQTLEMFASISGNTYVETPGWIDVSCTDPLSTEETRIDRAAAGRFFRAIDSKGYISISDAGQMALTLKSRAIPPMMESLLSMIDISPQSSFQQDTLDLLKFYGSLSGDQIDLMNQGQTIQVGRLLDDQRKRLEDLVYETYSSSPGQGIPEGQQLPMQLTFAVRSEPTEQFPDGLPSDATFIYKPEVKDTFWVSFERDGWLSGQCWDLGQVAEVIVQSERPDTPPENQLLVKTLAPGTHRILHFDFSTAQGYYRGGDLQEMQKNSADMTLDSLPQDLKDKLNMYLKSMRQMQAQQQSPQTTKPPR